MTLRRRRSTWWSLLVAAVLALGALTACSPLRSTLGTTNGPCYVALPRAFSAIHDHGHLVGVRLESVDALRTAAPLVYAVASAPPPARSRHVCLVAYSGSFSSGSVRDPRGSPDGRIAIVVLLYPQSRVLGTFIAQRIPLEFGHAHLGPA
jgi:hypothetical protein